MNKTDFLDHISEHPELEWLVDEANLELIYVRNNLFDTMLRIEVEREPWLSFKTFDEFVNLTHQGKNVEHVTRVTGFFSKVSAWNKGKQGELTDRNRQTIHF